MHFVRPAGDLTSSEVIESMEFLTASAGGPNKVRDGVDVGIVVNVRAVYVKTRNDNRIA